MNFEYHYRPIDFSMEWYGSRSHMLHLVDLLKLVCKIHEDGNGLLGRAQGSGQKIKSDFQLSEIYICSISEMCSMSNIEMVFTVAIRIEV